MASLDAIRLLTALSKTEGAPSESGFQAWRRMLEEALTEVQLADWIYYKVVNKGVAPARVLDAKKTLESYSKRMQSVPKDVFAALDNVWISGHPVSKEGNAKVEAASFAFAVYKAALFHDVHPAGMLSEESLWDDDVDGGRRTAAAVGAGGIAINHDGTLFASVDQDNNRVLLASTTAVLGDESPASTQFHTPVGVTFAHRHGTDTLLVCDAGNDRIVELSDEGHLIRHVPMGTRPISVAYSENHDLIAISLCSANTVVLLRYETGEVVTTIGGFGSTDGKLNEPAGVRFTADGAHIIVADYWNHRVSKFRISDGAFVTNVATEALHGVTYPFDVLECDDGSIMVACNVEGARGSSEVVLCKGTVGTVMADIAAWSFAHSPGFLFVAKELSGRLVKYEDAWFTSPRSAWVLACGVI